MDILNSHRQEHIVAGVLLSIILHIAIAQAGDFSDKLITADIFSPPSMVSFQFIKKKKIIPKPVIIEKPTVKKEIIKEVIEEVEEEKLSEEPLIKQIPKQENIIPIVTEIKLKGKRIAPKYPKRSLRLKQEGTVLINVLVGTNGKQQKMVIVKSSKYPLLDKAALDAVSKWEFSPTVRGGISIISWIQVPVEFIIQ